MRLSDVIKRLNENNIHIALTDDKTQLKITAAKGAMTPALMQLLKDHKTDLLAFAQEKSRSQDAQIAPRASNEPTVLSSSQQRLWFIEQLAPGNVTYHVPLCVTIRGQLNKEQLQASLDSISQRHDSLRTAFSSESGIAQQWVDPEASARIQYHTSDLHLTDEAAIKTLALEMINEPFDLSQAPLMRVHLVSFVEADDYLLIINLHHLITDGWSNQRLLGELAITYQALSQNEQPILPTIPIQYADYAEWQQQKNANAEGIAFWKTQLSDVETLNLPLDHSRQMSKSGRGHNYRWSLPNAISAQLKTLSQTYQCTDFVVFLAAFQLFLHKLSHQTDIIIGAPTANRQRPEVQHCVGFFVNTLALRVDIDPNSAFLNHLEKAKALMLSVSEFEDIPFETVVDSLGIERDRSITPLFQVMINYQQASPSFAQGDLDIEPLIFDSGTAKFDLTLSIMHKEAGCECAFEYDADLFESHTIERFALYFTTLLKQLSQQPETPIHAISLLNTDQQNDIKQSAQGQALSSEPTSIAARFSEMAERFGDKDAVCFGDDCLSYQALDHKAAQMAHYFHQRGFTAGSSLLIALPRSMDMLIAVMACYKLGGYYIPLDPNYPQQRQNAIINDAQASLLLTNAATYSRIIDDENIKTRTTCLCIDEVNALLSTFDTHYPIAASQPSDTAYMIYTSGSTGKPKGVKVPVSGVFRLADDKTAFNFSPFERIAHVSNVAFDASIWEIFGSLLNGATLVGIDNDTLMNIPALTATLKTEKISAALFTVQLFNLIADTDASSLSGLDYVGIGGEAPDPNALKKVWHQGWPKKLVNLYGPTENSCVTTFHEITPTDIERGFIPLGRPVADTRCYVIDAHHQLCPIGVRGQLAIAGRGLSSGYHQLPEKNAAAFIRNPFQGEQDPYSTLYLTGDQCLINSKGLFEFHGRIDDQIKLRGFRIELGEILRAVTEHAAIKDATIDVKGEGANRYIAAYLVANDSGDNELLTSLRNHLMSSLPHYMVPTAYAILDQLPVTANGKIDKKALNAAEFAQMTAFKAPESALEKAVAESFKAVLNRDTPLSVFDDFFTIGGHSLLATRVIAQLRETLSLDVQLRDLFDHPTVELLAAYLQTLRDQGQTISQPIGIERPEHIPLSFAQQRLWFIERLHPGSLYHMPFALKIDGELDTMALQFAFSAVIMRHESLRTRFVTGQQPDQAFQVIDEEADITLITEPFIGRESDLIQPIQDFIEAPFDLEQGPLVRAKLLSRDDSDCHYFILCLHHIIADGWSIELLMRDLFLFYQSILSGQPLALPPLTAQYADFTLLQNSRIETEKDKQLAFWQSTLADCQPLQLLTDFPRPAQLDHAGAEYRFQLDETLSQSIRQFSQQQGCSLFMTLLAALNVLLSRYSHQHDITIGTPIANRSDQSSEHIVGLFLNTLALRNAVNDQEAFIDFLARVKDNTLAAFSHQDLPFDTLIDELGIKRDLGQTPIFQVMLILQTAADQANRSLLTGQWDGLSLSAIEGIERFESAKFDLTVNVIDIGDALEIAFEYRTRLFEARTIERLARHFDRLLQSIIATPESPVSTLPVITDQERQFFLSQTPQSGPNATQTPYPSIKALHHFIEKQVLKRPQAVAIVDEQGALTYQQLNDQSNQLAHAILASEWTQQAIGLSLYRSRYLSIGLLAILKAGRCYVPIDPDLPDERKAFILNDCNITLTLTDHQTGLNSSLGCALWSIDKHDTSSFATENPVITLADDALLNIIYTSGSTGHPKGVMVPHRGIINRLQWMQATYPLTANDRILQKTPFTFDVSVWEILWPLMTGARLVFAKKDGHKDPAYLAKTIIDQGITCLHFVPSMLQAFLHHQAQAKSTNDLSVIQQIFVSGEALQPKTVSECLALLPNAQLDNLYGPTEASIDVTFAPCRDPHPSKVLIGRPIANTQILILDQHKQLTPLGVAGELYIGGDNLALGYLHRETLTNDSFIDNPFTEIPSQKLYKTGDLGRYLPEGDIEYLGRNDFQVKIRGQRIELGDIENTILQLPYVDEIVVVAKKDPEGDLLVAYYTGKITPKEILHNAVKEQLPSYMLPSIWQHLPALPLNPNGKIDRKALPAIEVQEAHFAQAETVLEKQLCQLFANTLSIQGDPVTQISIDADFFLSGGHSLKAIRLVAVIDDLLGVSLPVSDIFLYPTVRELSLHIEGQNTFSEQLLPIVPVDHQQLIPASFNQQQMWLYQSMHPDSNAYHLPMAFKLTGRIDANLFHRALNQVIERHSILRTALFEQSGSLYQSIMPTLDVDWLTTEVAQDQAAYAFMTEQAMAPFDLSQAGALRAGVIHYSNDQALLYLVLHHAIADASTLEIILTEMVTIVLALQQQQPIDLPTLSLQYADFAYWQHQQAESLSHQLEYWQQQLHRVPNPSAFLNSLKKSSSDLDTPSNQSAGTLRQQLDTDQVIQLRDTAKAYKITPFMLLLANLQWLLAKTANQHDICISVPVTGRHRQGLDQLAGYFVNTLSIRQTVDIQSRISDFLANVKQQVIAAFAHQDVALEQIIERLGQSESVINLPAKIGFNYFTQQTTPKAFDLNGCHIEALETSAQEAKYDLIFSFQDNDEGIVFTLEYNASLYDAEKIAALGQSFQTALDGLITGHPDQALVNVALIKPETLLSTLSEQIGSIDPKAIEQILPLTPMQRDIYIDSVIDQDNRRNYLSWVHDLHLKESPLDIERLQTALALTIKDHAALRMRIIDCDHLFADSAYQVIVSAAQAIEESPLDIVHFETTDHSVILDYCQRETYRPFSHGAPLFHWMLLIDMNNRATLFLRAHHACLDGLSLSNLSDSYTRHYQDGLAEDSALQPPLITAIPAYADFVTQARQKDNASSQRFWQQHMASFHPLNPPAGLTDTDFQHEHFDDSASHLRAIEAYCEQHQTTVPRYIKALYTVLLNSYCLADNDFYFHEVLASRPAGHLQTLGCYYSMQPVCIPLDTVNQGDFKDLLHHLQEQQQQCRDYRGISNGLQKQILSNSECQFLYNFYVMPSHISWNGEETYQFMIPPVMDNAVNFTVQVIDDHLRFNLSFSGKHFINKDFIYRLIHLSQQILQGQEQLSQLALHLPNEPVELPQHRSHYPEASVMALIQPRLKKHPHATAVIDHANRLTYAELDHQSNQVANQLLAMGIEKTDRVGLALSASCDYMVALIAVLKTGAAYVAIDKHYPVKRQQFIIDDANIVCVITDDTTALPPHTRSLAIQDKGEQSSPITLRSTLDDPLYAIYTSGSTGLAKGTAVSQRNFMNLLLWYQQCFTINTDDKVLIISSVGFDLTQKNLLGTLYSGATLVFSDMTHYDPERIVDDIERHQITLINAAPSACYPWLSEDTDYNRLSSLRYLLLGGESVKLAQLRHWFQSGSHNTQLVNMYGPSECTDIASFFVLNPSDPIPSTLPIGIASDYVSLYAADYAGRLLPVGLTGELLIAGDSLGLGYIGQAAHQQTAFFKQPNIGAAYKTGDLVKQEDGLWHFIGRKDHQMKVRGIRIEPEEIRIALHGLDTVKDSLVMQNAQGDLIAYVISEQTALDDWRETLAKTLPPVMIPSALMCLTAFPLSANGKIDRSQLPPMVAEKQALVVPTNPLQEKLLSLWQSVLNTEAISIDDNFFTLGGHSLLAAQLVSRIRQQLSPAMTIKTLFDHPSISELSAILEHSLPIAAMPLNPIDRSQYDNRFALSMAQERLWLLENIQGPSAMYIMPLAFRLTGDINENRLQQAIKSTADKHQVLYTRIVEHEGKPYQQLDESLDLLEVMPAERTINLHEQAFNFLQTPFQVKEGPLFRASLLTTAGSNQQDGLLLVAMHHLISDGLSMQIFMQEIISAYANHTAATHSTDIQYIDYSEQQRAWFRAGRLKTQLDYWQSQLQDPPILQLPNDYPYSAQANVQGAIVGFDLPQDLCQAIAEYARQQQVSVSMLLMAAYQLLLSRYSHQQDIIIGTAVANRPDPVLETMLGFFVNTLAIRSTINGKETFEKHVQSVKNHLLTAFSHQDLPFEQLIEALNIPRDLTHSPLFQAFYSYQTQDQRTFNDLSVDGLSIAPLDADQSQWTTSAKFELSLHVFHETDADSSSHDIQCHFEYRTALFKARTIDQLASHFKTLLMNIVSHHDTPMAYLDMLTEEEKTALRQPKTDVQKAPPFLQSVYQHPSDALAIDDGQHRLTYAELIDRSDKLAIHLQQQGIKRYDRVALLLSPNADFMIALLAVIRIGGCYIPLDKQLPTARLVTILQDADCALLMTQATHTIDLPEGPILYIDDIDWNQLPAPDAVEWPLINDQDSLYMIYTSGSTGKPKGVEVLHQGENNLIQWYSQAFGWHQAPMRFLILSSLSFDLTQKNFFTPLATGGEIHFPKETPFDPVYYCELIESRKIQVINCAPSAFYALLDIAQADNYQSLSSLQTVLLGGETIDYHRIQDFVEQRYPDCQLVNMYGPTECTDIATYHKITPSDHSLPITIGKAIPGVELFVLDEDLQWLPKGAVGELCIAGEGLALGYWQQKALTQAAFVWQPELKTRLYRTGDLVSWDENNALQFHGRSDHQIKIRGFRIELHEIEKQLTAYSGVEQALVIAEGTGIDVRLIGYVVGHSLDDKAITAWLRLQLADYMIPEKLIIIDAMPLNTNGKIDRNALPKPDWQATDRSIVVPNNDTQMQILAIWQQVLQHQTISIDDSFFVLGGHSLKAAQIVARIRQCFQVDINLRELLTLDTIEKQAELIITKRAQPMQIPSLTKAPAGTRQVLSYAQQRLWLLAQMTPDNAAYNMPAAWRLTGVINKQALSQALHSVVARHDSLRTRFINEQGEPVIDLLALDQSPIQLTYAQARNDDHAVELAKASAVETFALDSGQLLRLTLVSINEKQHVLLMNMHHIISDGLSVHILLKELLTFYVSHAESIPCPLPAPFIQYSDYAHWQRNWLKGDVLENELDYWRKALHGVSPLLPLPLDFPRPPVQRFIGREYAVDIDPTLAKAIKNRADQENITPFMLMLSMYQLLLNKFCQHDDIPVGIPLAGRSIEGLDHVIGFFINALVVRTDLSANMNLHELMQQVKTQVLSAFAHEHVPIEMLLNALNIERNLAYTPVVQCAFNMMTADDNAHQNLLSSLKDLTIEAMDTASVVAKFDLQLNVLDHAGGLNISMAYNQDIFTEETIAEFLTHYIHLLTVCCQEPEQTIHSIDIHSLPHKQQPFNQQTLPLTAMQRDIYLSSLARPDTLENSLGYAWYLPIAVDIEAWYESFSRIHRQFAALQATVQAASGPYQEIAYLTIDPNSPIDYQYIDLTDASMSNEDIQHWLKQQVVKPYDFDQPLVSYRLMKFGHNQYWFTFACHHILCDGFSGVVHLQLMIAHYESLVQGTALPPPAEDHFIDYTQTNRQQFDRPETLLFWQEQLQHCQPLSVILPPSTTKGTNQLLSKAVDIEHFQSIKRYCKQHRITPALYFKALYALLIKLYTGAEADFVITEFNGGRDKITKDSMGCFYHTQPFLFSLESMTGDIGDLFKAARQQQKNSRPYLSVSHLALKKLLPASSIGFSYNYLMLPHTYTMLGQTFHGNRYTPNAEGMVDFRVQADGDDIVLWLAFHQQVFSDHQFLDRLLALSAQCVQGIEDCSELNYLLDHEALRMPSDTRSFEQKPWIHEHFQQQVKQTPKAMAISDSQQRLSYHDLDLASNQLANYLISLGVRPNQSVALCLDENTTLAIGLWAIIKTGAAYVPIDVQYPIERIHYILSDAQVQWVIAKDDVIIDQSLPTQRIDAGFASTFSTELPEINCQASDRFYTLYTSGSTGKPKGASVSQDNEANLIDWYLNAYAFNANDHFLLISSIGFDLTQKNLIAPLCSGGALVFNDSHVFDANQIIANIQHHAITIINCAPSALYALLETPGGIETISQHLRCILLGGEAIQWQRLQALIKHTDFHADIVNMYGPTECTDISTAKRLSTDALKARVADNTPAPISLGEAIPGVDLYILNQQHQILPDGFIGELAIAGRSVGLGYWQRPDLNQQAFITNPFAKGEHDSVLYLTGDLVYRDTEQPDLPLYYVGRKDFQVKLNGRRMELGEIESTVTALEGIQDCRVLVKDNSLIAFIISDDHNQTPSPHVMHQWRQKLQQQLPHYMLPSKLHTIEQFPLNANGKVDRKQLLALETNAPLSSDQLPVTETEKTLSQLWHEVLGQNVAIDENFFAAGGDSLAAVKLIARIELQFSIKLPVASLFSAQTITQQAQLIEQQGSDFSPLVCIQSGDPARTPIFAVHALGGMVLSYQPLASALGADQPFYALQAYGFEEGQTPFTDLESMVNYYYDAILKQHDGPYQLIGHSFGGLVALEIARKLNTAGYTVNYLGLIDTHQPLRYFTIPVDDAYILKTFVEHNFGAFDVPLSLLRVMPSDKMIQRVVESLNGAVTESFIHSAIAVIRGFQTMMTHYKVAQIDIPLHLFRPEEALTGLGSKLKTGLFKDKAHTLGWHKISGDFHLHRIKGHHLTLLSQHADDVAQQLIRMDDEGNV